MQIEYLNGLDLTSFHRAWYSAATKSQCSFGARPLVAADRAIFSPCSSVPVMKNTSRPCNLCQKNPINIKHWAGTPYSPHWLTYLIYTISAHWTLHHVANKEYTIPQNWDIANNQIKSEILPISILSQTGTTDTMELRSGIKPIIILLLHYRTLHHQELQKLHFLEHRKNSELQKDIEYSSPSIMTRQKTGHSFA